MYSVYSERQTDCEKAWLQDLQIHLSENVCVQTFLGTSELKKNMLKISYFILVFTDIIFIHLPFNETLKF